MATRIQMRRGTTSEWNSADPTLNEGEIGYNSTLGQIKIGDGSTIWSELDYIVNSAALDTSLGSYIPDSEKSAVNGVAELDASKNILAPAGIIFEGTANDHETTLSVTDPTADRTITFPDATGTVALTTDISVTASSTNTFSNKSISLGSNTVTSTLAQLNTAISDADVATLAGTETLTNKTLTSPVINTPTGITKTDVGLANLDNTSDANKPVSTATQTALDLKANLANPTFTGTVNAAALTLSGDLTVNGTTTTVNSTTVNVTNAFVFEGTTADAFETTLTITDPTADRTITLPDSTGTVALTSDLSSFITASSTDTLTNKTLTSPKINENVVLTATATELNYVDGVTSAIQTQLDDKSTASKTETLTNKTITSPVVSGLTLSDSSIVFEGATANDFETTLTITDPTADRTITFKDESGTVAYTSDLPSIAGMVTETGTQTLTNKTLTLPKVNENVDLTATSSELNILDGATLSTTELNYVDGVTSAIQTQLDGKVDESLFDAKGDILVASADNTPVKLSVGTNGYILTANSSATNGIEWAVAPAGYSAPTLGSTSIASGATVTTIAGLTLSSPTITGSLTAGGGTGTSGQVLQSTGSGVQWSTPAAGAAFSEFMLIGA
jgi:hypothetical protein